MIFCLFLKIILIVLKEWTLPVQDESPQVYQRAKPDGPRYVNLGTVEYEPLQATQARESVRTDEIDVTVVKGKSP